MSKIPHLRIGLYCCAFAAATTMASVLSGDAATNATGSVTSEYITLTNSSALLAKPSCQSTLPVASAAPLDGSDGQPAGSRRSFRRLKRRDSGPCQAGRRSSTAIDEGAAAGGVQPSFSGRDRLEGPPEGAAPNSRYPLSAANGSEEQAPNSTTTDMNGVVIPYPGEHEGTGGNGDSSGSKHSDDGKEKQQISGQPHNSTVVGSTVAHEVGLSTVGNTQSDSWRTTAASVSSQTDITTAPLIVSTHSGHAEDAIGAPTVDESNASATFPVTTHEVTTGIPIFVPPKPTKMPADNATEPKVPPKTPPPSNSTLHPSTVNCTDLLPVSTSATVNDATARNHSHSTISAATVASSPSPVAVTSVAASTKHTTNSGSSSRATARSLPPVLIDVRLRMTRERFCCAVDEFRATMASVLEQANIRVSKTQIRIIDIDDEYCPNEKCPGLKDDVEDSNDENDEEEPGGMRRRRDVAHPPPKGEPNVAAESFVVQFYVSSDAEKDMASKELTKTCYDSLMNSVGQEAISKSRSFKGVIEAVIYRSPEEAGGVNEADQNSKQGVVIVIALAGVAGTCLAVLALLQVIVMRRRKGRRMRASQRRTAGDTQSMQSLPSSIAALRQSLRRSYRGRDSLRSFAFANMAMHTDKEAMSNPMSFSKLASRSLEVDYLEEEFKSIPTNLPRMSQMQQGWANKNRFANIIPIEETRVKLKMAEGTSDYINANFVSGYRGRQRAYIAAQSPMRNTIVDFWRMVWEQQSQVVVALTNFVEDGQPRCAEYLPDASGLDSVKVYGEFQVTAQKQLASQNYIFCVITLRNMENNLLRQIVHFQYTAWPATGVPESVVSMTKFVNDLRPYAEVSQGPIVVHCSTGTGRTGTLLAIDIGMHAYDDSKTIDVMNLVYRIRKDRGGAVQTKEQYAFVYKALLEYAGECASSCSGTASLTSAWSSRSSLHECQNEV